MTNLETLTQINLDDLVSSFGWENLPAKILRKIFFMPAKKFAQQMLDYDSVIGHSGLPEASRRLSRLYTRDVRVFNSDRIPDSAFLALSNHPGVADTLAIFSALNRRNLKIIALDRPFLNTLPNLSQHLFYVKNDSASRIALVRQVSGHLRGGGATLTFPAGHIEPDPNIYTGAAESLNTWTDSVGVFIRMAPETALLPVLVRNVVWDKAAKHPLLKIKKAKDEKEKLATALQLLSMVAFDSKPVVVTVQIGNPITVKDLGTTDTQAIHKAVLSEMKKMIETPPQGAGVSAL